MRRTNRTDFDVIVLGSGIAGGMLATILARRGISVVMIDAGVHPRFVVGESTIPHTSQLITMLSAEHDVPELDHLGLGSPDGLRKHVSRNCGIKHLFGFAYHRAGQELDPRETHQFGNIWRPENHLFRQDIDAYLFVTAIRYGAHGVQNTKVESVETGPDGVAVVAGGKRYTGKFLVDGTGFRSVLADKYGLREQPSPLFSRTRSLFTHMVDVTPFEEVVPSRMTQKWSQSTLHHCFKRGWFWVIPFNNWEGAPNKLVSVGLTLDEQLHPEDPSATPEEEFARYLEMFPSVDRQFKDAKLARPWVRTERLQYSSKRMVGERWALLSHAAGFVDPLYSRGLINTVENIGSLCRVLLQALEDGDFAVERFERVERGGRGAIEFADKLVAGSYISWDDFDLWNAWLRLWAVGVHDTESRLGSVILMGRHSRFKPTENYISSEYEAPNYRALFESMWTSIRRYDAGELTLEETRKALWGALERYDFSVPLRDGFKDHEWAMKHRDCRDLFLGIPANHERWAARQPDADLA